MLDTIKFAMSVPLKTPGQCQIPLPSGKYFRCWIDPTHRFLTRVECSLPKLVYGHNGRLIGDQEELDHAIDQLRKEVAKVADVPDFGLWVPSRCDLVWQLGGMEAGKIIDVLAEFQFPRIQKPPMHVAGQSVSWRGANSRFVVSAYDKARQFRIEGDVLRIEVRLCGHHLRERFGQRVSGGHLVVADFAQGQHRTFDADRIDHVFRAGGGGRGIDDDLPKSGNHPKISPGNPRRPRQVAVQAGLGRNFPSSQPASSGIH